jgi:hypothetical protein
MQGVQGFHSKVFRAHWNSTVGSLSFMLETWLLLIEAAGCPEDF